MRTVATLIALLLAPVAASARDKWAWKTGTTFTWECTSEFEYATQPVVKPPPTGGPTAKPPQPPVQGGSGSSQGGGGS